MPSINSTPTAHSKTKERLLKLSLFLILAGYNKSASEYGAKTGAKCYQVISKHYSMLTLQDTPRGQTPVGYDPVF